MIIHRLTAPMEAAMRNGHVTVDSVASRQHNGNPAGRIQLKCVIEPEALRESFDDLKELDPDQLDAADPIHMTLSFDSIEQSQYEFDIMNNAKVRSLTVYGAGNAYGSWFMRACEARLTNDAGDEVTLSGKDSY